MDATKSFSSHNGGTISEHLTCEGCCTKITSLGVNLSNKVILHDVNMHMDCGELTILIGPNGAGKTTLFRAILGEIKYTGKIRFQKVENNPHYVPVVGYVPQKMEFDRTSPFTVLDLFSAALQKRPLWLGNSKKAKTQAEEALSLVDASRLLREKLGTLSGGELQRVLLALALKPIPDLLLLDEPVSGIDPAGVELFYNMVSSLREKYHIAIIMVSHDIPEASRHADRIIFLNRTVIYEGPPTDAFSQESFKRTFGHVNLLTPLPHVMHKHFCEEKRKPE
jgi:zinc transport system ATP-binding protein